MTMSLQEHIDGIRNAINEQIALLQPGVLKAQARINADIASGKINRPLTDVEKKIINYQPTY